MRWRWWGRWVPPGCSGSWWTRRTRWGGGPLWQEPGGAGRDCRLDTPPEEKWVKLKFKAHLNQLNGTSHALNRPVPTLVGLLCWSLYCSEQFACPGLTARFKYQIIGYLPKFSDYVLGTGNWAESCCFWLRTYFPCKSNSRLEFQPRL